MHAANQLPKGGPLMWIMPLHLHVNKKPNDDDAAAADDDPLSTFETILPSRVNPPHKTRVYQSWAIWSYYPLWAICGFYEFLILKNWWSSV